ncbi:restriction endonuclease [Bacillus toyonensis]|uniref:restriction endonuclease n=1 Tax=Bacillus toyonensis TaxID=155322 RepID=UPI001CF9BD5C
MGAIDWSKIHWRNFEKFMFYALGREGFSNTLWFGIGGSDDARDITATTLEELPLNLSYKRKWIFQCKKWGSLPQKRVIHEEAEVASEHDPDFWVLIVPLPIHARYYRQLAHIESKMDFSIKVIAIHEIEMLLEKHKDLIHVLFEGHVLSDEVVESIDAAETVRDEQEVLHLKQSYKSDEKEEE